MGDVLVYFDNFVTACESPFLWSEGIRDASESGSNSSKPTISTITVVRDCEVKDIMSDDISPKSQYQMILKLG